MNETTLNRLEKLLGAVDDTVSKADFEEAVTTLRDFVQGVDKRTLDEVGIIKNTFQIGLSKLQTDHSATLEALKKEVDRLFVGSRLDQMMQEHTDRMQAVDKRLANIRDGKPGAKGDKGDKGEPGPAGSPDTPEQVRDKLASLEGDDRLDISAIKGVDKLEKRLSQSGGGTFVISRGQVKAHDLSDQLDGVTKTFSLPAFWLIIDVKLSSVPVMRPTVDYTTDGGAMQITFTSQIDAATALSVGQSCIIIYAEA